ncbi:MAG: glutamate--tRNA ligase [Saprospiraceae bacterium]|nr:glutamate--tRNA ligase [Saprospiraceae bacterium]
MSHREVRLRFAPSPTGALHIGGIRTALYNYLFAKKMGGKFILRIEDTDQGRYVKGAEEYILGSLKWLNLLPDEGPENGGPSAPYRQSERKEIYQAHAELLLKSGQAYLAFDSAEALDALRNSGDGNQKYDFNTRSRMRNSLNMSADDLAMAIKMQEPYVIRLKVPANEEVLIQDIIRGTVRFHTSELDDKVLIKSDGLPTYHMANVVDDRLMGISHVIRGEEWLSSTAHHYLLYKAFGWEHEMPQFAHLPLILKPSGNGKLSKRDGAQFGFPVFPMDWINDDGSKLMGFKEYGFEPESLLNFLALLGWHPGTDQELLSVEEMINLFSLDKIVKSGARFDFEKSKWFNQQHLLHLDPEIVYARLKELYLQYSISLSIEECQTLYTLYKDRVHFFMDYFESGRFYFEEPHSYDENYLNQKFKREIIPVLHELKSELSGVEIFEAAILHEAMQKFLKKWNLKPGELFPLLRVVMTGQTNGPDVFKMMEFMGYPKLNNRLKLFIEFAEFKFPI